MVTLAPARTAPSLQSILAAIGLAGLGLMAVLAGLSNVIASAPEGAPLSAPSAVFPFGTDLFGRDVARETLRALAVTVDTSSLAMLVAVFAGGLAGFCAARLPFGLGWLMRGMMEVLKALPALLLAILLIGLSRRGLAPLCAGLAAAPHGFVRAFDRASSLSQAPHAVFARATGVPASSLLRRDLVYDFRANLVPLAARALAAVTIVLSTVSFFGFGSEPPVRDLGLMIAAARDTYLDAWWTAAVPAVALALLILFARLAAGLEEGERP